MFFQACAYRLGELKIRELRRKAEKELGQFIADVKCYILVKECFVCICILVAWINTSVIYCSDMGKKDVRLVSEHLRDLLFSYFGHREYKNNVLPI